MLMMELAPNSAGFKEVISAVEKNPELLAHLQFQSMKSLEDYMISADYDDYYEIVKEIEYFYNRRKKYLKSEMDEIERAAQDLNRNENINVSVKDIYDAFDNASEITLTNDIWKKLENTESNKIKKGDMKSVMDLAKKYNKQNPKELKSALISGDYKRPLIIKFGDRYHLVAGNTRLCTAAAIGIKPKVLIAEL